MKRPNEPSEVVSFWLNEIDSAKKREKDFRKEGERILDIYSGKKKDETPFNILYSNTETLLPALYSQVPRPVVQRRFKDDDPIGKYAAQASQRLLEFLLDTNVEGYETYDEGMKFAVLDGLLPGRGITTIKYDATIYGEDSPVKDSELVCVESRYWDRVYFGYAKKWSKVPWIAYEEYIDKEEATRLFGDLAEDLSYSESEQDEEDKTNEEEGSKKTCLVYQIWDKDGGKKIRYISPAYKDGYLKEIDDPLELTGFYNCPKPLTFVEKSNDLSPTTLFSLYENQAKELNEITRRINRIVKAIKARFIYDASLGDDLKNLFEADDNEGVPSDKSSSLAAEKGLQNAIWFAPLEQLITTLRELFIAREQCKQVIYEITGIADILRGSTKASETLGAQQIKERWGTVRLKRLQKEVQRYSRDILRMMVEVACKRFSEETWSKMTGLPFLTEEKALQLQQLVQATSSMPPNPQLQAELQKPVWKDVLQVLQNDLHRAYKIDIETNSTIEPDSSEDKKDVTELMNAMGQYLNGVGPMVREGVLPFEAATAMLLAISRRFRFGAEVEDYIKQMKAPQPKDNGKESKMVQEMTMLKAQVAEWKVKLSQAEMEKGFLQKNYELEKKELELSTREELLGLNEKVANESLNFKSQVHQTKVSASDQVRTLKEKGAKREMDMSKGIDMKMAEGIKVMENMVSQLAQVISAQTQYNQQQAQINQEQINQMISVMTAPRKRIPVRGADGRISEVNDVIAPLLSE